MSKNILDLHKIENYLLRLGSITECISQEGTDFITKEVRADIEDALNFIKHEFEKVSKENDHE